MTSFNSLPFELQQMILLEALPLDLCRCSRLWPPIVVFENLALNTIYALPPLKERVIEICNKRLAQRELERTEFNKQHEADEEAYHKVRRLTCSSSFGVIGGFDLYERDFDCRCGICMEIAEQQKVNVEQAGHPNESCSESRNFLELLPQASTSEVNREVCPLVKLMRQRMARRDGNMLNL